MARPKLISTEKTFRLTFQCTENLKEKMIKHALKEQRTISQEIRWLLERAVAQLEKDLPIEVVPPIQQG